MGSKINILLQDLDEDDIDSLIQTYNDVNEIKKELTDKAEELKNKIRIHLKERKWNNYKDPQSKTTVSLISQKRESVNKNALKMLLNDEQYSQVITTTSYEKILIITPKDRERLKKQFK